MPKNWESMSQWYQETFSSTRWEFLRPMVPLVEWVAKQEWSKHYYPATSHEWLCVSLQPDFGIPFFSTVTNRDTQFEFELYKNIGVQCHASRCSIDQASKMFQDYIQLLHCISSPLPLRPALNPDWLAWNDGTVPRITQAIYDERAFDRMPVLADALEDAGCTDRAILDHCRQPGPHVRGCWVVDLLLGKE